MTVSSSVRKAGPFAGNNIATTFPFSFKVFAKGDLKALLVNSNGVSTPLTLDSDYSVQLNANQNSTPGGWITYPINGNPLSIGNEIVMLGDLAYDQETDITNAGGFYPSVIEDMSDRSTIQIQQLAEIASRALVVTEAETTPPTLPNAQARANSVLGFDASGNIELFGLTPAVGAGDLRNEAWTAGTDYTAGTSSSVTLSRAYGAKANLGTVVMAGIPQDPASYTLTNSGNTLQFDSTIPAAVNRIWCVGGTTLSIYTPPSGSVGDTQLQWTGILARICDSISALKSLNTVVYTRAFLTGFAAPHDGGGGNYWFNPNNTSAEVPGIIVAPTNGVGRWELIFNSAVSVLQCGVVADAGVTDNSATLLVVRNWIASNAYKNQIYFPPGVYGYSVSPNWAIQNATIKAVGEVRLRYSGAGNAVIIDEGTVNATYMFNLTFEGFIIEAPATAGHGLYVRSIHHSKIRENLVRGAGSGSAGIKVEFAVCTDFSNCKVTSGEDSAWYLNAKPQYGLWLDKRNAEEQTSYCLFANCIFEQINASGNTGVLCDNTLGNVFIGGTSESCDYGIILTTNSVQNKFWSMDLENNTTRDIQDAGQGNEFHGVDCAGTVTVLSTGIFALFEGGNYQAIELPSGVRHPSFTDVKVNRSGGGGFIIGDDVDVCTARFNGCLDIQSQIVVPMRQKALAPAAGPGTFTYTNNTPNDQEITMSGATVTATTLSRGGVDNSLGLTAGIFPLSPGDAFKMAYSAGTPSIRLYSK